MIRLHLINLINVIIIFIKDNINNKKILSLNEGNNDFN